MVSSAAPPPSAATANIQTLPASSQSLNRYIKTFILFPRIRFSATENSDLHLKETIELNMGFKCSTQLLLRQDNINESEIFQPREIRLASGRKLTYIYDSDGGLERVMLPRGSEVRTWRRLGPGLTLTGLQLPGHSEAGVTSWDAAGRLAEVRPPGGDGIILYR